MPNPPISAEQSATVDALVADGWMIMGRTPAEDEDGQRVALDVMLRKNGRDCLVDRQGNQRNVFPSG